ncbi:MAG: ADP-forming succinate--CoA ligase subunit beta [Candidatus Hydrogenedentes bacterium CG07_land_8_20_14_0_80_42_17]|nr:MAG: ADP-forming succinate--CoA ligase subunit beta [Candidatus Hydrogenedentes bacterium CG07_land_8_20_14_0_80_42_17]
MKIHEYQAKQLLASYGAPIPLGDVADTPAEVLKVWNRIGKGRVAVKAQIHAGGRGKGGGIKLAETEDEVLSSAKKIIGMNLVTHQTGPEGIKVRKVLVEEALEVKSEFYAGITLDRSSRSPVLMVSKFGGMEIEEVAAREPDSIVKMKIHPLSGLFQFQARELGYRLGLIGKPLQSAVRIFTAISKLFVEKDASLIEINPLFHLKDDRIVAGDAKIGFDDSALYKHEDIEALRDEFEEEPAEREARKANLSYVKLDGNIGCMVNGAGLAMATLDILKHFGGTPANFLDIGGGAKRERVKDALKIILTDKNVKAIFINIFGGIVRCDEVAHGVISAKKELGISVPITIRLTGTNEKEGRSMLESEGFATGVSLDEAAQKAVRSAA